jgi:mercuric transport protein
MTCATCPKTVKTALEGVEGVHSAEATFEPPEAVVRFDPDKVSVEELTTATKNAGYPSRPKSSS